MKFNLKSIFNRKPTILNTKGKIAPTVLLILDGYGIAPPSHGNAVVLAGTPVMDSLMSLYPHGKLVASGEAVGLPATEVGNTEVGHITMGAGRVMFQGLKRINNDIESRIFYDNDAFIKAVNHARQNNSDIHLMGLAGQGQVHASVDHLYAILQIMKNQNFTRVYLHLFTDGRDSPPRDSLNLVASVKQKLQEIGIGQIASISGRYYAMDRDFRWERTEKVYKALTEGVGQSAQDAQDAIKNAYANNKTDEFIDPTVILSNNLPVALVKDNDAVIFYNYRIDRPRQLTMAFTMDKFESLKSFEFAHTTDPNLKKGEAKFSQTFNRNKRLKNIFFVTMTEYQNKIPVSAVAFPPQQVADPLSFIISAKGLLQMHMAESEKERFVTYYFDGLREQAFPGEDYTIVPSPKVATYDRKPEMSLSKLIEDFKNVVNLSKYHFIVLNIANPDMVAHSGNLQATIKAIKIVDAAVGEITEHVLAYNGTLLITGDHGNAEELVTFPSTSFFFTSSQGSTNTDHSSNPVPLVVVKNSLKGKAIEFSGGSLVDIAPTILAIMNIPVPISMTGRNLFAEKYSFNTNLFAS
ncbi:MAG: 2,3-bisphosphoglycerate-independent phosphoglycerate mutase [Candidatus Woesebacteria bacterium GW2011_GWB1_38_5b]|uniref:2,3-bisphosphoglycerate-independent phosphoglycerate mutase n=1 Tax=Candidatus Woesebacteria bacterium GW2011_GWB1_38_5b TaxID=1618569 RepID=A0A0G0MME2_9BACT|nr:MAG: 2,3-bisphosphoglycerate-independent phosphoglycerate mutase [Candidatus Woesebacteria bacterium GW2011_GWB1_38_5b]